MKFEQMQYARPDFDAARETFASLRARIAAAPDAQAQLEAFREFETLSRHISTMSTLAEIRHTVDTRDAFYEAEREFFDANSPALGEAQLDVYRALLASPFRTQLEQALGRLTFEKMEVDVKSSDPAILELMAEENAAKIQDSERLSVLYTSGSSGLNTNAKGSTQAQVLDLMGLENAAVVEDVSNKGGGNPINLEQLYRFDPDVILFAAGSIYAAAADDAAWQPLRAIEEGDFYEIPSMPYNWLSNPPSLNMLLGIWWLGNLLYPQYYDYDMVEKTQEIFQLFWDYDLSGEEARQMLANSTLKDTP